MQFRALGKTGLSIAPLVFGGNVFGWTADEKTSFDLLDAFTGAGFNAIDTADVYSRWAPGNQGGESETIIGKWLKRSGIARDRVVVITKVGSDMGQGRRDLRRRWIVEAVENSLKRLQTDHIDLYLSHWPDPQTPYEETLEAHAGLVKAGKVRAFGASNLDAGQLQASFEAADKAGLPRYGALQPEYNLYDRTGFEGALADLCRKEDLGVITYYSLASGFLTGKYRTKADTEGKARGEGVVRYLDDKGLRILAALDKVAAETGATPAEIALAWLMAKPAVTAPIASATSLGQLASLMKAAALTLSAEQMAALDTAGA
ncbi:aldo/keto reductase [Shinella yambaruensis]|uniref:NADP-dependent aryl-alcohol dehydrogenase n=1 Tax=Shinella yambaruensis TaxID=415996 RepID=A0ABQ5ZDU7_9HYPH|nr:aldo/keto reductase [Shinella yambaruensis]MCJ8029127.1 aldo/keto reductase [Shinella yambaruensis]MCU7982567.1 aldo/keto reductase [Shinella yambaruensis]GLR50190.1 NADP-dependent aryl-alcohol dehydrogenase [Shinella yambaruensis]